MDKFVRSRPVVEGARRGLYSRTALCGALGLSLLPATALAHPQGGLAEVNAGGVAPTITLGPVTSVKLNAPRTINVPRRGDINPKNDGWGVGMTYRLTALTTVAKTRNGILSMKIRDRENCGPRSKPTLFNGQ